MSLGAVTAGLLSLFSLRGPAPQGADAPADVFSAERALRHVEIIAREPHPVGSPANAAVRDYLIAELRQLGLEPRRQLATITRNRDGRAVNLENVMARMVGSEPGPGVLLTAHYDSVATGPGAADDAAGVAALLETLRVLRQGPPPRRTIVVLFSDAEEAGLHGAKAFVDTDAWSDDVGLVVNFEARGNAGPAFLFELSPGNRELVAAFARVVARPVATSISNMIYRRMPNDTDFTVYQRAGIAGLNFAFFDGAAHYHQPTDTPANLDLRSLQHTGDIALALAQYFGYTDVLPRRAGDAVFFNLCGSFLVHYPVAWVRPGALLLAALAGATLWLGCRRRRFDRRNLVRGLALSGATVLLVAVAAALSFRTARALVSAGGREWLGYGYAAGLLAAVVVTWGIDRCFARENDRLERTAATFITWLVVAIVAAFVLPEASYVFFWPALAGWLALGAVTVLSDDVRPFAFVLALLAVGLAALITAPLFYYAFIALPVTMPVLVVLAGLGTSLIPAADALRIPARPT